MNSQFKNTTEIELIKMMSEDYGNKEAIFTEIYKRLSKPLYSYCVGACTGDKDKANDLFQDTFIRFHDAIKKTVIEKPLQYIIRIARNKHLSNQEKIREEIRDIDELDVFQVNDNKYEKEELYNLILSALDLLDDKYRDVFVLREFEMMSFQEIADLCNLSLSNAKMLAVRSREKIVKILQPYIQDLNKS
ncbi:MAG: RNA polymerase sigma factor [Chlorobiota bacterium]|nr:RNA polymerase sigma factor [Chlorobiota bacterium]QQS66912.1 MAG: RNA polymerase sigma factor [Chlorobiota bacterium]